MEELIDKNEQLQSENTRLRMEKRELRAENTRMCKRIETLEATLEEWITKAIDEAVAKATTPFHAIIEKQKQEIDRLKSQIGKDSSNSSKPQAAMALRKY